MNWGYSKKKEQSYIKKPKKPKVVNVRADTRPNGRKLKARKTTGKVTLDMFDGIVSFLKKKKMLKDGMRLEDIVKLYNKKTGNNVKVGNRDGDLNKDYRWFSSDDKRVQYQKDKWTRIEGKSPKIRLNASTTTKSVYDMAGSILQKTHDGDDLAPEHLRLLELAVNDMLSEKGKTAFRKLYNDVKKGYKKPWFMGVEGITQDLDGYIYWKGRQVEHYSHMDADEAKREAEKLRMNALDLESRGIKPTSSNILNNWDRFYKLHPELRRE